MLLASYVDGEGPAVVLLHAGVADRSMWSEVRVELAARGYRAIVVDLPGFGETPVAEERDAPWLDVLETATELGAERFTLVGNSFGGAVALRVAASAPGRLDGLVLVSTPSLRLDPSPELTAIWDAEEEALDDGDVEAATAAVVRAWTLPDAPEELRERVAAMQRRAYELQLATPEPPPAPDPLAEGDASLRGLGVPALVAAGEHDLGDFRAAAAELAACLGAGEAATIAGAGHLAPLERPREFTSLLLNFLGQAGLAADRRGAAGVQLIRRTSEISTR